MNVKLLLNACAKFFCGLVFSGLLLFLPAGTFCFWNAWLFIALLFVPMAALGIILSVKSPQLLAKRLSSSENEPGQKVIVALSALIVIIGFVVAAFDFRFGWSQMPVWAVATASAVFLAAYGIYMEVMRENAYLSRTVEIQENQVVIDTGLYGIVRHPMYFAAILLYMSIPIILGSVFAFIAFVPCLFLIIARIIGEEAVLEKGLSGYSDYKQCVKYRLIPFVW